MKEPERRLRKLSYDLGVKRVTLFCEKFKKTMQCFGFFFFFFVLLLLSRYYFTRCQKSRLTTLIVAFFPFDMESSALLMSHDFWNPAKGTQMINVGRKFWAKFASVDIRIFFFFWGLLIYGTLILKSYLP